MAPPLPSRRCPPVVPGLHLSFPRPLCHHPAAQRGLPGGEARGGQSCVVPSAVPGRGSVQAPVRHQAESLHLPWQHRWHLAGLRQGGGSFVVSRRHAAALWAPGPCGTLLCCSSSHTAAPGPEGRLVLSDFQASHAFPSLTVRKLTPHFPTGLRGRSCTLLCLAALLAWPMPFRVPRLGHLFLLETRADRLSQPSLQTGAPCEWVLANSTAAE